MTAILATLFLALAPAKTAILKYETYYWKHHAANSTSIISRCKRKSPTRVRCEVETTLVQRAGRVRFTTTPEAIGLPHGVVKIHPGTYGFIETEKELQ